MTAKFRPLDPDFGFTIEFCSQSRSDSMCLNHHHDFYEFYFSLGPSMRYFIKDRKFTVSQYDMVFIDRNTCHHSDYDDSDPTDRIHIYFDERIFTLAGGHMAKTYITSLFRNRVVALPPALGARFSEAILRKALPEYEADGGVGRLRAGIQIVDFFLEIYGLAERGVIDAIEPSDNKTDSVIGRVIQYIDKRHAQAISLDALSASLFLNKYYICHVFKREMGLSIVEYIHMKRLTEAEQKLRDTELPVTAVALAVGFGSVNYFNTLFKRKHGITPTQYRENQNLK